MPAVRRATFRAPDLDAVATLELVADEPNERLEPAVGSEPAATDPAQESGAPALEPVAPAVDQAHHSGPRASRTRDSRHEPRHRADRVGNRRPSSGLRRVAALGCASLILGGSAFGAVAASADDSSATIASAHPSNTVDARSSSAADELVSAIGTDPEPVVTSGLSTAAAPFTGGTQVTVQGEHLDSVAEVTVGGVAAPLVAVSADTVTFAVPGVDDAVRGEAAVAFTDAGGREIEIEVPVASSPAATSAAVATAPVGATADLGGVVTRVEQTATGTKAWVGGHTKDADYWDVDEALASGGGTVSYFSLS